MSLVKWNELRAFLYHTSCQTHSSLNCYTISESAIMPLLYSLRMRDIWTSNEISVPLYCTTRWRRFRTWKNMAFQPSKLTISFYFLSGKNISLILKEIVILTYILMGYIKRGCFTITIFISSLCKNMHESVKLLVLRKYMTFFSSSCCASFMVLLKPV